MTLVTSSQLVFACHTKACAPPPVGVGGSRGTGLRARPGAKPKVNTGLSARPGAKPKTGPGASPKSKGKAAEAYTKAFNETMKLSEAKRKQLQKGGHIKYDAAIRKKGGEHAADGAFDAIFHGKPEKQRYNS